MNGNDQENRLKEIKLFS